MGKKKSTSVSFYDLEGTHLSIHWNPTYKRFSIGITDSCGKTTNTIGMGYEDLRSLFKEAEEIFIQHEGLVREPRVEKPSV